MGSHWEDFRTSVLLDISFKISLSSPPLNPWKVRVIFLFQTPFSHLSYFSPWAIVSCTKSGDRNSSLTPESFHGVGGGGGAEGEGAGAGRWRGRRGRGRGRLWEQKPPTPSPRWRRSVRGVRQPSPTGLRSVFRWPRDDPRWTWVPSRTLTELSGEAAPQSRRYLPPWHFSRCLTFANVTGCCSSGPLQLRAFATETTPDSRQGRGLCLQSWTLSQGHSACVQCECSLHACGMCVHVRVFPRRKGLGRGERQGGSKRAEKLREKDPCL